VRIDCRLPIADRRLMIRTVPNRQSEIINRQFARGQNLV
jgi:hypothetical protein